MTKKAKLIVDGKEIEVEITQEQLEKLCLKKKTGYERAKKHKDYYFVDFEGDIAISEDVNCIQDNDVYNAANYYSDKTVAENNARADKLMRQLRRFAVEHREKELDWNDEKQMKYSISYGSMLKLGIAYTETVKRFGGIYFDTEASAQLAIDTFKDELLWYFTEYKDSL